jgi:hypothetical protein
MCAVIGGAPDLFAHSTDATGLPGAAQAGLVATGDRNLRQRRNGHIAATRFTRLRRVRDRPGLTVATRFTRLRRVRDRPGLTVTTRFTRLRRVRDRPGLTVTTRFTRLRRVRDRSGLTVTTRFTRLRRVRDRHGLLNTVPPRRSTSIAGSACLASASNADRLYARTN